MSGIAVVALIVLAQMLGLCGAYHVPIQAHSFNDLDYLSNLIDKGIDYFKLDVSMANRQSCKLHSRWNSSKPCLKTHQYTEQICCLAFRGDASSRPNFNYDFNITTEFVDFIGTKMSNVVNSGRRILFAINFQYQFSFDDYLTEQFLLDIAQLFKDYKNNLLIGTGSDSFILEYDRICFGKGSPECNQNRRRISESPIFLQTGSYNPIDPRDHYKRYRNFNIYYKGIDSYCRDGFPDWLDKYPEFPLIFWEPSNERQIKYVLDRFLAPSCMKKHQRTLLGMAMATNIDSEMFEIYMKKLIPTASTSAYVDWLAAAIGIENEVSWEMGMQNLFMKDQGITKMNKITLEQGKKQILIIAATDLYNNALTLQAYEKTGDLKAKLIQNRIFKTLLSGDQALTHALVDQATQNIILITNINKKSSKVYYFDSNNAFELVSFREWDYIHAASMRGSQVIYVTGVSAGTGRVAIQGMQQFKQIQKYAEFQISLFMTQITSVQYINEYIAIAGDSSDKQGQAVFMFVQNGQLVAPAHSLGYGNNPQMIRKSIGAQLGIILSNSMCNSALLANNNDMNKCTYYLEPEFASIRSVGGVINLIEADFMLLAKSTAIPTPCGKSLFRTKLANGNTPTFVQLPTWDSYAIGYSYIPVEDQDLMAALFCGASNFDKSMTNQKGTVIASIRLHKPVVEMTEE